MAVQQGGSLGCKTAVPRAGILFMVSLFVCFCHPLFIHDDVMPKEESQSTYFPMESQQSRLMTREGQGLT